MGPNTTPTPVVLRAAMASSAVRGFWERFFRSTATARFEAEEIFAAGDRCVVRWLFRWDDRGGHVRAWT